MANWSAQDIPDQSGRTVVVTGANSGIGLVTARELARRGAEVTLAVRDPGKGEQAAAQIRHSAPSASVDVGELDLADLASVRRFASERVAAGRPLDLLVNNAGVMALPRRTTADGFEMQLGTNHLGHFALTGLLLSALLRAPHPRVVTLASGAHRMGKINFDDLQGERRYRRWGAYGQSKLANLLFAFELGRRAAAAGSGLLSVAAHPGYAATNLQTAAAKMKGNGLEERLAGLANRVLAQSGDMGALPTLYAATLDQLPGGAYAGPDGPLEMRGHPKLVGASGAARDEQAAARLWSVSQELTGVSYDFAVPARAA